MDWGLGTSNFDTQMSGINVTPFDLFKEKSFHLLEGTIYLFGNQVKNGRN
jgi:hypothetical protein